MSSTPPLTAHQLARLLLDGPDLPVVIEHGHAFSEGYTWAVHSGTEEPEVGTVGWIDTPDSRDVHKSEVVILT